MKMRKKLGILLLSALWVQLLSGCRLIIPSDRPLEAPSYEGFRYGPPEDYDKDYNDPLVSDPAPAESGGSVVAWDVDHTLDISFVPVADGELEMPVAGATGYTSVDLYLWAEEPSGDWCKLANIGSRRASSTQQAETGQSQTTTDTTPQGTEGTIPQAGADTGGPQQAYPGGAVTQAARGNGAEESAVRTLNAPLYQMETQAQTLAAGTDPGGAEVRTLSSGTTSAIMQMKAGTPFLIMRESGDWWLVRAENQVGWVEHRYCLINLPDVIPSMVYDDTNSYASVFRASGKDIPKITDVQLYDAKEYNSRLGREEFMMPVLYAMAKKVCRAQQNALAEGNTIVLYEGFRPYDTQMNVVREVRNLASQDDTVRAGISTYPWNISWFIATGISNHQQGYAMDVSLARVNEAHIDSIDGYSYVKVDSYDCYTMPTPIHELSQAACTYTAPVSIFSTTAWQAGTMSPAMSANDPAKALQRYCTSAGMTPLASEWWHFNDLNAFNMTSACHSRGEYYIEKCMSMTPSMVG